MKLVRFDPSIVTVMSKALFKGDLVNSRLLLVKLSVLQSFSLYCCVVLLDLVNKSFLLCW